MREERPAGIVDKGIERAPAGVSALLMFFVGLLLAGGLYLNAVRGDAIVLDLSALSGMLFCF